MPEKAHLSLPKVQRYNRMVNGALVIFMLLKLNIKMVFCCKTAGNLFRTCPQYGRQELPSGKDSCWPNRRELSSFLTTVSCRQIPVGKPT
ncbi:hypothetical protein PVAP13_8NG088401 [Panicum virgatum]|uniref:Uncharacterized protein n=1 Tax=Panicum virgatum TaxID=38727 RepID=A0A8T0PD96_PANVG|nr:hypothetical protein PVAP13_8NG088401 [Panicum virgatum]